MAVFGAYSAYYDLLYTDKDYGREANFVLNSLRAGGRQISSVLELGCGTGKHAMLLAQSGLTICGVDLSDDMLAEAEQRRAELEPALAERLRFAKGDARSYADGQTYDAVISLFHVVSYQQSNDDLIAMFSTAAKHLKAGGVFFFDFWYGPSVLTLKPSIAAKSMENTDFSVLRVARPALHSDRSIVDVNYQILVRDKRTGQSEELKETHSMRYLFLPEIELLARQTGFQMAGSSAWMTGASPSDQSWGVCATLVKI